MLAEQFPKLVAVPVADFTVSLQTVSRQIDYVPPGLGEIGLSITLNRASYALQEGMQMTVRRLSLPAKLYIRSSRAAVLNAALEYSII